MPMMAIVLPGFQMMGITRNLKEMEQPTWLVASQFPAMDGYQRQMVVEPMLIS